ncbi:MAG: RrF2 family transcriptional regulator [Sphingomonadales bacterium]
MLRLSKKMRYALEAVVDIAYNAQAEPVQSKDITRRQGIPQRYLEQVMQRLVRAGILKGVRGPRGGYHLARERRRITVGEIVRVVAEMETDGNARESNGETGGQSVLGDTVVGPLLDDLKAEMMDRLDAVTVQDLCNRAKSAGVVRESRRDLDFTI